MKQVPQNEMDALLRKWSQSDQAGATETRSAHLDADELSAYAENVLPPVARAKYTEHLVDCSTCRRIVADLAPADVAVPRREEVKPSPIREFFSRLTSQSFLRYAVPTFAAVLILAVGFVMMNRQSMREASELTQRVARNEQTQPASPSVTTNGNSTTFDDRANKALPGKTATADRSKPKTESTEQQTPIQQAASTPVDAKRYQEEARTTDEIARADSARQKAAPPATTPSVAGAATTEREVAKSAEVADKKPVASEPQPVANEPSGEKKEVRKLDDMNAATAAPRSRAARRAPATGVAGMSSESAGRRYEQNNNANQDKDRNRESDEIKKVAGRSFRKVNGVWTDTAYNSGATTNLSRGSEQFRALVADEPSIRSIAEQLDGEVIVVWKGRTYRIR